MSVAKIYGRFVAKARNLFNRGQRIGWHISKHLTITRNHRPLGTGREPHLAHLVPADNSRSPRAD